MGGNDSGDRRAWEPGGATATTSRCSALGQNNHPATIKAATRACRWPGINHAGRFENRRSTRAIGLRTPGSVGSCGRRWFLRRRQVHDGIPRRFHSVARARCDIALRTISSNSLGKVGLMWDGGVGIEHQNILARLMKVISLKGFTPVSNW